MSDIPITNIRNFSIIAHIDHGKSTLADRLIELCGGLTAREMGTQVLDSMDLERERGITIKAQSVTLYYDYDNIKYQFNLIDTPGHVDFAYEVSRSLAACEGALLVVDAAQGVEAQTVAVCYTAIDQGLTVLPVLNKIDLPQAAPAQIICDIEELIGIDAQGSCLISAKTGLGIHELILSIINNIPPPQGDISLPLQALIIDSWFDPYWGVISLVRVTHGMIKPGDRISMMASGDTYEVQSLGIFTPKKTGRDSLNAGEVGYIVAGVKEINGAPVGDTITHTHNPAAAPLPGFKTVKPQVYAGLYPLNATDFPMLRESLAKLRLNDAALFYEPESSGALGFGFRCGFLGMLHLEIVQERITREYGLELLITAPSVVYEIITTKGETIYLDNPSDMPSANMIASMSEPIGRANILVPQQYLGEIISLCQSRRGVQQSMLFNSNQVTLSYDLPMAEIIVDFFDRLKSVSRGYASLDYNFLHFAPTQLIKLDILINGEIVDALSVIMPRTSAYQRGKVIIDKMSKLIPRQMFDIALQAAIGGQIIARSTVKALRKNVTAKCYGGDITRKRKLLEKQKAGKKRMKQLGNVVVPQEAFLAVLQMDGE